MALRSVSDFPRCEVDRLRTLYTLLTYQFCHADALHLGFNCAVQIMLATPHELLHGAAPVLAVYQIGVVAGALTVWAFSPFIVVVGASGGVYCLIGPPTLRHAPFFGGGL